MTVSHRGYGVAFSEFVSGFSKNKIGPWRIYNSEGIVGSTRFCTIFQHQRLRCGNVIIASLAHVIFHWHYDIWVVKLAVQLEQVLSVPAPRCA